MSEISDGATEASRHSIDFIFVLDRPFQGLENYCYCRFSSQLAAAFGGKQQGARLRAQQAVLADGKAVGVHENIRAADNDLVMRAIADQPDRFVKGDEGTCALCVDQPASSLDVEEASDFCGKDRRLIPHPEM
jgi:hypothetical protein